jgi:hypothetical protein
VLALTCPCLRTSFYFVESGLASLSRHERRRETPDIA